ncbi:hypothetical protein [Leuconostoc inhae]|uniref:hypothetical protein n=1 Tax=Leuconostoc inhae TaxID=178001 RepID=UPI001C7CCBD1|nr:hypothetical protein [Leuconostoc inhae]
MKNNKHIKQAIIVGIFTGITSYLLSYLALKPINFALVVGLFVLIESTVVTKFIQ